MFRVEILFRFLVSRKTDSKKTGVNLSGTTITKNQQKVSVMFFLYFIPLPLYIIIPASVGFAVGLMILFKVTHPPAGSNPIIVIMGSVSLDYLINPIIIYVGRRLCQDRAAPPGQGIIN